jgi:drug/metabolite transporter (DMT)-like permease
MSILIVVGLYALWSSVFSLGKIALEVSPPLFLTAVRMLLAGTLLYGYLALRSPAQLRISAKQIFSLSLLALFSIYLANAFEFWGLKQLSAAKTCFIYSLSPFLAALFSYLHFGERMNRRKWIGMGIGFLGLFPVLLSQKGAEELLTPLSYLSWPELSLMAAAACGVYGWILLRMVVKDQEISPLVANGTSMLIGGLMALGHSLWAEPWNPLPVSSQDILPFSHGVLLITLLSNIVCYNLYGYLLRHFTATFLSFVGLLSPIFASVNAWLILGEVPSPAIFVSTAIVSCGLWLVYSAELKQGYLTRAAKKEPT